MKPKHRIFLKLRTASLRRIALGAAALASAGAHAASVQVVLLHAFNYSDGAEPSASLVLGSDGNFYGTTDSGAAQGGGSIFKITPGGTFTTLYSFPFSAGSKSSLVQGTDGNYYGTTLEGGTGWGTVYKMSADGAVSIIHVFNPGTEVSQPAGALTQGADGNFYGTATDGPSGSGPGGIYKMTPDGALTVLYVYPYNSSQGANPRSALMLGSDGNFYGTTEVSSTTNTSGTVFRVAADGTYSYIASPGSMIYSNVVAGPSNSLWGTTTYGGVNGKGSIYKLSSTGKLTTVYSFTGAADGSEPMGGLVRTTDGSFFGTTYTGGSIGCGTLFRISPLGTFSTLYSFDCTTASGSQHALVQGPDGAFYGTSTVAGGAYDGAVYKLIVKH